MGCIAYAVHNSLLDQLTDMLRSARFQGFLRLYLQVTSDSFKFIRLDPEYDGLELGATVEIYREPLHQLLYGIARRKFAPDLSYNIVGIAVRLYDLIGISLEIPDVMLKHYWAEIDIHSRGASTARGITVKEARRRAYRSIERLNQPDLIYRT
ncbi:MAG: hypothetical protein CUN57_01810, partial [Phototrophicales bacterium]